MVLLCDYIFLNDLLLIPLLMKSEYLQIKILREIPDILSENSASGIANDFYGINRNEESVSEHIKGIISKNQTAVNEAMAILYQTLKNATDYGRY